MATIQEVAKYAGVSVATVSRVINTPDKVKKQTLFKVQNAIRELNYEPSVLGRSLRTSRSGLLLVLLPSVSNPFYAQIINGIQDKAIASGYNILLCETDSDPDREVIFFNMIKNKLADGIISMDPTVNKESLIELSNKYPIVQCSEYAKDNTLSYVTIDSKRAAYQAVKHLIKLGHKKIGLINFDKKFLYASERYSGYEKALKEFDLKVKDEWIYNTKYLNFESGQQAMRVLLNQTDRPTAVFAVSDVLAVGALKELHINQLKVPEEMALFGFDNIEISNVVYPPLTTVAQPMYDLGAISAQMLMSKIKGEEVESRVLDHQLIIRETT
ncbi:LacI family DNA-binding transcriptional regulator [Oceanobacillus neutriphilus]|uniref:DNA-binding transcriptional regulator CytR n=1 Tax=Oceanobacillus neutriphilus TaxID=531815 RepID=A0ABQ2NV00_9BACI|nr:LacI family DNA-binding transcriptional regulator [Oceanobacillus neutriphilus]GGP11130.1 DNA-binding transcriptional regulator CytR [Oceanobacillus neutriphilus]